MGGFLDGRELGSHPPPAAVPDGTMKRPRIVMVARTAGLEYDDRIRKECLSLAKIASLRLYVNFADNREEEGITAYGIPYRSFRLRTRDRLKSGKHLLLKSAEFYWRVRPYLPPYDLVWVHELYTYMFPLMLPGDRCVWDLHELPTVFERDLMRPIFHRIERKCRKILHANPWRISYLLQGGTIARPDKHLAIRNYPDQAFTAARPDHSGWARFAEWRKGGDYVFLQGLSVPRRYPANTIEAVLRTPGIKAVVVGAFDDAARNELVRKFPRELGERVFFTGMVDQMQIPAFIAGAAFSIVLYDTRTPNNRFCEPNRMYQAIAMGVPVIVGCNEPMSELVTKHGFGVCLASDGREGAEIERAIGEIMARNHEYRRNIQERREAISWERQESALWAIGGAVAGAGEGACSS